MRETFVLTLRLFIITAVAALVLALGNNFTAPIIAERQEREYQQALKVVYESADTFEPIEASKLSEIHEKIPNIVDVVEAQKGGEAEGWIIKTLGKGGYGGDIEFIVAVDKGEKKIVGYQVLNMKETKGLGSRVGESDYAKTVVGNLATEHLTKKDPPDGDHDIQAISGTTISVNAVLNGLNAAVDALKELE